MPSIFAHVVSASFIAVTFARVAPGEVVYMLAALISATVVDLEHLVYTITRRIGQSRPSPQHNPGRSRRHTPELLALLLIGILSALLFWVDQKLAGVVFVAFTVHLMQDWLIAKTHPLAPVDKTATQPFVLTTRQATSLNLLILVPFCVLWTLYLLGVI